MSMDAQFSSSTEVCQAKRVVCVWEMGGNLGHLTNLKLFVDAALERGLQVSLVVRQLQHVATVFPNYTVDLWQAPHLNLPYDGNAGPMVSYTDMVLSQAFASRDQLSTLLKAWDNIFSRLKPDLVIFDHAPTALIASVGQPWEKWAVGSGFLIPRSDVPYFGVFPDVPKNPQNSRRLQEVEQKALGLINDALRKRGLTSWNSLSLWFEQCDLQLLTSFPEADHFGARESGHYLGVDATTGGREPAWGSPSADSRPRVFVYVNEFEGFYRLLDALCETADVIVYCKNANSKRIRSYEKRATISSNPFDMFSLLNSADYFVTNGNHSTCANALQSGIGQMVIPLQREQMLMGVRVKQAGRGLLVRPNLESYSDAVKKLFGLPIPPKPRLDRLENHKAGERISACFQRQGF